jgi:hypothetical protein
MNVYKKTYRYGDYETYRQIARNYYRIGSGARRRRATPGAKALRGA